MAWYRLADQTVAKLRAIMAAWDRGELGPKAPPAGADRGPVRPRGFPPYLKRWYRVVSNDGAGAYTVVRQQVNASTHLLEDTTDNFSADWDATLSPPGPRQIAARDIQGYEGGEEDRLVQGWAVFVNGDWITALDLLGGFPPVPDDTKDWMWVFDSSDKTYKWIETGDCA